MIHTSSGLNFQGDSESAVRISEFYLCGLPEPYFWKIVLVKLDSTIADVATNGNAPIAGIHHSYMYESYSKRDFGIFWSGCCDITKSSTFHRFLCFKCIQLAILRHRHETHSIVCIKCESKEIVEKFKVLVRGHTKECLRVVWNVKLASTIVYGAVHLDTTKFEQCL